MTVARVQDAVDDCEECLVHFPTFRRLGEEVPPRAAALRSVGSMLHRCTSVHVGVSEHQSVRSRRGRGWRG